MATQTENAGQTAGNAKRRGQWPVGWLVPQILLWLAAIIAIGYAMTAYQFSTEQSLDGGIPQSWPDGTKLTRTADRSTLLLFLHPKCPCSRATLAELERLAGELTDQEVPDFVVVVTVPNAKDEDWVNTATVDWARNILHARVLVDVEGVEARNFGAVNSGLVVLYAPNGDCTYAGGITVARGQEGENVGSLTLASILKGDHPTASGIPAFGCRLCLPEERTASTAGRAR